MEERRKTVFAIVLLAAALVVGVGLSEVMAQLLYRAQNGTWLFLDAEAFRVGYTTPVEDRRGYALRPGFSGGIYRISPEGLRGDSTPRDAAPFVVVVGDSVPFGSGVPEAYTYPRLMDGALRPEGWRVVNGGVPSYNLRQAFDHYRHGIGPLYPASVLLVHAANDMSLLTHYRERWSPDRTWGEVRWSQGWSRPLRHFALAHYLLRREREPEAHAPTDDAPLIAFLDEMLDEELARIPDTTHVVLVSINPFYYHAPEKRPGNARLPRWRQLEQYVGTWEQTTSRINEVLRRAAAARDNVSYLDLRAAFDEHDRAALFIDYIHYSPAGAKLAAQAALAHVAEQGALAASR